MNPRIPNQKTAAMTLVEVLLVIIVLIVLAVILLPALSPRHDGRQLINCPNNLKQIGLAYYIWAEDQNGKYPMQVSVTNGGTMELNNGSNAWLDFLVMSNELATPKVLWCPGDTYRFVAQNFNNGFSATNISYFVGMDANTNHPQMFLSGDDNFAIRGVPVKSGLLEFSTNAPITWTSGRHEDSEISHLWIPTKYGNIGLVDGSVETVGNSGLANLFHQTGVATNRLAIP